MIRHVPIDRANASQYRALRLRALREDPTAFGTTFDDEARLGDTAWTARAAAWTAPGRTARLAFSDGVPCALAGAFLDADDPSRAHLVHMWVAPEVRGQGIGQGLVEELQAWADAAGARTMALMVTSTNGAVRFYERLGFAPTGRTEPYPNDPALVECEMERSLA